MPRYQELEIYQRAMDLSARTWDIVRIWSYFHKDTLGRQIVRSADSTPANIAEGHGRYTFKDRLRFSHYARGSLYEYETRVRLARIRGLVDDDQYRAITEETAVLGRLLNGLSAI